MSERLPSPGPSATGMLSECPLLEVGLALVLLSQLLVALVGLPLFGDGAYYFFAITLDGEPVIPNGRLAALPFQLPALVASWLSTDIGLIRHVFALTYAALPVASLLACWALVRRCAPQLILFPALGFVMLQVNFSSVSELLISLQLVWPFVLMALVVPGWRITRDYGMLLAPLLVLLHPLSFVLAAPLSLLALLTSRTAPLTECATFRRRWVWLAAGFALAAGLRLLWTGLGANAYERGRLVWDSALRYLLAETLTQGLLLTLVVALGLLLTLGLVGSRRARETLMRLASLGFLLLPLLGLLVAIDILGGEGIKLKVALTLPIGVLLMALAVIAGRVSRGDETTDGRHRGQIGRLFISAALAILLIATAKSVAWWTATHGLMNATASAEVECVSFDAETPYALQWPWMVIIDNWTVPMNALVFRAPWPIAPLLPADGCRHLRETGQLRLASWIEHPVGRVETRFGPLRGVDGSADE